MPRWTGSSGAYWRRQRCSKTRPRSKVASARYSFGELKDCAQRSRLSGPPSIEIPRCVAMPVWKTWHHYNVVVSADLTYAVSDCLTRRNNATMRVSHSICSERSAQRRLMCSITTSLAHHSGRDLTGVRYYEAVSIQSSNWEKCFDTARRVGYQKFFLPVLYCRCRRIESPQDTFEIFHRRCA